MADFNELKTLINMMRSENAQSFSTISQQIKDMKSELSELKTDMTDLKLSLNSVDGDVRELKESTIPDLRKEMMEEINALKKQRLAAELYSKRQNLLFYGIKESTGEDCERVMRKFLRDELKYDQADTILFANLHRLPTRSNPGHPTKVRPVIVKFVQMKDRDDVLRLAQRLKGTGYGISQHLPVEMQNQRKMLLPIKRQAIAEGKRAYLKTTGTEVTLFIDNIKFKP